MSDHTPDALASALPAGIVFDFPQGDQWGAHEIAEFQAEELAESGYVLLHPGTSAQARHTDGDAAGGA